MEKIVLVSRERADLERLIALVESVFPECTVEIVEETGGWLPCINGSVDKSVSRCCGKTITLED
jgi:hypothetical protein